MVRLSTAISSQQLARVALQAGSGPMLVLTPAYEVKTFCIHTTLEAALGHPLRAVYPSFVFTALCTNGYAKPQNV